MHAAGQAGPACAVALSCDLAACSCCGLLRVRRLPALNTLARPLPPAALFLLRHKRRRLAIEELQASAPGLACPGDANPRPAPCTASSRCMQAWPARTGWDAGKAWHT